jgi:hypothetical protein
MQRGWVLLGLGIFAPSVSCERHTPPVPHAEATLTTGAQRTISAIQVGGDDSIGLHASPIDNSLLEWILNTATITELDSLPGASTQRYRLRLFGIGVAGSCVEYTEAIICSHQYLLAVSEAQEGSAQRLYNLGRVGRITAIEWIPGVPRTPAGDTSRLRLTIADTIPLWHLNAPEPTPVLSQAVVVILPDRVYIERAR